MGGEPYTWRRVRTVRGQAVGNLSPKGDKAPTAEPTCDHGNQSRCGKSNKRFLFKRLNTKKDN